MSDTKKILIAGCGAIGSAFACLLRSAGNDVALLGRDRHLSAIRSQGLYMDRLWRNHRAEGFFLAARTSGLAGLYDPKKIS
ncbi:MAG: ketopantoate reductase family protein [Candidatus Binatia bacterium]